MRSSFAQPGMPVIVAVVAAAVAVVEVEFAKVVFGPVAAWLDSRPIVAAAVAVDVVARLAGLDRRNLLVDWSGEVPMS